MSYINMVSKFFLYLKVPTSARFIVHTPVTRDHGHSNARGGRGGDGDGGGGDGRGGEGEGGGGEGEGGGGESLPPSKASTVRSRSPSCMVNVDSRKAASCAGKIVRCFTPLVISRATALQNTVDVWKPHLPVPEHMYNPRIEDVSPIKGLESNECGLYPHIILSIHAGCELRVCSKPVRILVMFLMLAPDAGTGHRIVFPAPMCTTAH